MQFTCNTSTQKMFDERCRICLTEQTADISLFTIEVNNITTPTKTGLMYLDCFGLELVNNQFYPNHICNCCKLQLDIFHNFLMLAKRSYEKFTKSDIQIKTEMLDTDIAPIKLEPCNPDNDANKTETNNSGASEGEELITDSEDGSHTSSEVWVVRLLEDDVDMSNVDSDVEVCNESDNGRSNPEVVSISDDDDNHKPELLQNDDECHKCNDIFSSIDKLQEEFTKRSLDYEMLDKEQSSKPPFECTICGKGFKLKWQWTIHYKMHMNNLAVRCKRCGKRYHTNNFKMHACIRRKPYSCDKCLQPQGTQYALQQHSKLDHSNFRFYCRQCNMKFVYQREVNFHVSDYCKFPKPPNVKGWGYK